MMNDSREWAYAYEVFERAANSLLDLVPEKAALDGLTPNFLEFVDDYLSPKQFQSHPIVACFSKEPDSLSQWRAYADDGRGWSIGFNGQAIGAMPVTLLDVLYNPDQQTLEIRNFLAAMFLTWKKEGGELEQTVGKDAALLSSLILSYKHPSFHEEREVRALHELRVDIGDGGYQLIDEGGIVGEQRVQGEKVSFRAAGAAIVSYIDIGLQRNSGRVIEELWFGPANHNSPWNALHPLTQHGHRYVEVKRSGSSYRT